ncbi:hypothetical protein [Streptomyces sp. NBC_00286]|uniref:hypothetical protein n=1 Tax=Streptomyces sp. NBC_00286 TaxID=2975701 RepID=UPI002E2B3EDC|nr:hypothetical protein [Streptomyces sp. NBC_00286]
MAESVPVRCPACRREHVYAAPSYPCVCGAPVTPELDRDAVPESLTHHTWDDDWITVQCAACGRQDQWPRPELGCPCGTVLRVPLTEERGSGVGVGAGTSTDTGGEPEATDPGADVDEGTADGTGEGTGQPSAAPPGSRRPRIPLPRAAPSPRPPFNPVTIRTARDAVTAAALYLRWLGYQDIRRADQRPPSGIGLAARGVLAQVDPTLRPASLRDVECLWLTAMTESTGCVYFSLAGYAEDARSVADSLGVPLFVLDLTGTPQPVNSLADELVEAGA